MIETIAICYAVISLVATVLLAASGYYEIGRKLTLIALVWLLPVLGAIVVLVFHSVVHTNMTTRPQPYRASDNNDDIIADIVDID